MNILVIQTVIGLIAATLFRYKNRQRYLVNTVSILVFVLFLSKALIDFVDWGLYFWIITATGFLITYALRFIKKEAVGIFEILKLIAIVSLTLYPLSTYHFEGTFDNVDYYLANLIIPTLGTLYIYDRLILNTEMKKRFIVILSIQSVLILLMSTYAILQKAEADVQRRNADTERAKNEKLEYKLHKLRIEKKIPI